MTGYPQSQKEKTESRNLVKANASRIRWRQGDVHTSINTAPVQPPSNQPLKFVNDRDSQGEASQRTSLSTALQVLQSTPALEIVQEFLSLDNRFHPQSGSGLPIPEIPRPLTISFSYVHLPLQPQSPLANRETDVVLAKGQSFHITA